MLSKPKLIDYGITDSLTKVEQEVSEFKQRMDAKVDSFRFLLIAFRVTYLTALYFLLRYAKLEKGFFVTFFFMWLLYEAIIYFLIIPLGISKPMNYRRYRKFSRAMDTYRIKVGVASKEKWLLMDGRAFEVNVANMFRNIGYDVSLLPVGPDGGIDIILKKDEEFVAVQCKAHNKVISSGVVRDLYGVCCHGNYTSGIIVSFYGLSKPAEEFCSTITDRPIYSWDINKIIEVQKKFI